MIKIEFPADRTDLAAAFSRALAEIATGAELTSRPVPGTVEVRGGDMSESDLPDAASRGALGAPYGGEQADDGYEEAAAAAHGGDDDGDDESLESAAVEGDSRLDEHGVPFNADLCAKAAEPFYKSGPRKGQWKKRKGVSDQDYDAWYAGALQRRNQGAKAAGEDVPNTSAVYKEDVPSTMFNDPGQTAGKAFGNAPGPEAVSAPSDTGAFMTWVSEMQAAGRLSQDQVNGAYQEAGVNMGDLFAPNTPDQIAASILRVWTILEPATRG